MPNPCPHDVGALRDRVAVAEARLEDQRARHDRLEGRLDAMQRKQDEHHAEVMEAIHGLRQQAATDEGAREERCRLWRRGAIIAGIASALVALGWVGQADASPAVASVGAQKELKINKLEVAG